ncbi:MAG TPA: hypothetical protein VH019_09510 [Rhizomicrobium sp.]|jgi:hypothetical protein|nr:hypothetical protein [Rhizomicrobium sp.]
MTNYTVLFCALALSLALISLAMVPGNAVSRAVAPSLTDQPTPIHSLTGVSFHAVAGF